jgi:hypothetical protein
MSVLPVVRMTARSMKCNGERLACQSRAYRFLA